MLLWCDGEQVRPITTSGYPVDWRRVRCRTDFDHDIIRSPVTTMLTERRSVFVFDGVMVMVFGAARPQD
jgi:hypothetical protein